MISEVALLHDMGKAITEMEVALAILKPDVLIGWDHSNLTKAEQKKAIKKRQEHYHQQQLHILSPSTPSAGVVGIGSPPTSVDSRTASSTDLALYPLEPPKPTRSLSNPSSVKEFELAVGRVNGLLAPPMVVGEPSISVETIKGPSVAVNDKELKHTSSRRGLKGLFRKSTHSSPNSPNSLGTHAAKSRSRSASKSSQTTLTPRTPTNLHASFARSQPSSPIPSAQTSPEHFTPISPTSSVFTQSTSSTSRPTNHPSISSPLRAPGSENLPPALAQLTTSLYNLRILHNTLLAYLSPITPRTTPDLSEGMRTGGFGADEEHTVSTPRVGTFSRHVSEEDEGEDDYSTFPRRGRSPYGFSLEEVSKERSSAQASALASGEGVDPLNETIRREVPGRSRAHTRHDSMASIVSSVLSVWYDAEVELPIDDEDVLCHPTSPITEDHRAESPHSTTFSGPLTPPTSTDSHSELPYNSAHSGEHQHLLSAFLEPPTKRSSFSSTVTLSPSTAPTLLDHTSSSSDAHTSSSKGTTPVPSIKPRTTLPARTPQMEVSLLSVLRKTGAGGSMPVTLNEPLSLLQRLAEDVEYVELMEQAVASSDPIERLALVSAFAISGYAASHRRTSRKPFNPLLGETYDLITPKLRFVAEKTVHSPTPILASHADGAGWRYWATSSAKNKLNGMSLEIQPVGRSFVEIEATGERFTWGKPSSYMRNLVGVGKTYLETIGKMEVTNLSTGDTCVIHFKEGGWGGSGRNVVSGVIATSTGQKRAYLDGKWDASLSIRYDSPKSPPQLIWSARSWPQNADQYYGWNAFTLSLNQLDPSLTPRLPPTDSRLNPSQRALEEGHLELAESEKVRLEQKQRERNRAREARGEVYRPRWFVPSKGKGEEAGGWEFGGEYWARRDKGTWEDLDLW